MAGKLKHWRWAYYGVIACIMAMPFLMAEMRQRAELESPKAPYGWPEFAASLWSDYGMAMLQVGGAAISVLASIICVYVAFRKPKNPAQDERWREEGEPGILAPREFWSKLRSEKARRALDDDMAETTARVAETVKPPKEPEPEEDVSGFFSDWTEDTKDGHLLVLVSPKKRDEHGTYRYAVYEDSSYSHSEGKSIWLSDVGLPFRSLMLHLTITQDKALHEEWVLEVGRRRRSKEDVAKTDYESMKPAKPRHEEPTASGRLKCTRCGDLLSEKYGAWWGSPTVPGRFCSRLCQWAAEGTPNAQTFRAEATNTDIGIYQG